ANRVKQVQREFELRAEGLTLRDIRRQVIAEGFIPADKVASYYISGIEARLKNRFYAGYFRYQAVEYKGKHELIIPPKLFAKVQKTFGRKNARRSHGIFG